MFSSKKHKVHFEFKDHVFRYVETTQPFLRYIKSFGERYIPPGVIREGKIIERETLTLILSEVVNDHRFRGRRVHFCVPDDFVVVRKHTVKPDVPEEEIKGYLFLEIGESIHLPFEDAQFDFSISKKSAEGTEIILVASPKNTIEEYRSILEDAKLKPVAADLSSLSIYRLLHTLDFCNENEHVMVIQFDIRSINVTIFHQHIPQFTRHLKMNLDHELWTVEKGQEGLGLLKWTGDIDAVNGQVQEMITELERMMSFYRFSVTQGRFGVTKILLTGDYPNMEQIVTRIKGSIDIPVEQIPELIAKTGSGVQLPARFHEVVGLSLKKGVGL